MDEEAEKLYNEFLTDILPLVKELSDKVDAHPFTKLVFNKGRFYDQDLSDFLRNLHYFAH